VAQSPFLFVGGEMLVKVIKNRVPNVGKFGDTREIPERAARILILLGSVEEVSKKGEKKPKKRRYVRRDMRAEEVA
jgi:hypothetical protein